MTGVERLHRAQPTATCVFPPQVKRCCGAASCDLQFAEEMLAVFQIQELKERAARVKAKLKPAK